jgi:hypothetical protein
MIVYDNWHGNVCSEKIQIEELFVARMYPVLEHSSFSLVVRIRLLEQNLGLVNAQQPHAAVRRVNDNMLRKITQQYGSSV